RRWKPPQPMDLIRQVTFIASAALGPRGPLTARARLRHTELEYWPGGGRWWHGHVDIPSPWRPRELPGSGRVRRLGRHAAMRPSAERPSDERASNTCRRQQQHAEHLNAELQQRMGELESVLTTLVHGKSWALDFAKLK